MFRYLFKIYLWASFLNYSGALSIRASECKVVSREKISDLCKSSACLKVPKVAQLCETVYEKILKCDSRNFPLRTICDGIAHCSEGTDEEPSVCWYIGCHRNFYKCPQSNMCIDFSKLCNGINDCDDGSDEMALACRTLVDKDNKSCPDIFDSSHIATCHIKYGHKFGIIPCSETLPPGTQAEVTCRPYHEAANGLSYQLLTCQENGMWDADNIIQCISECGILTSTKMQPLILNGRKISPNSWPWYAALYQEEDHRWKFFCSSTIISASLVVTAAHCVWNEEEREVKVVAGKQFSDFYAEEPESQILEAKRIIVHPLYQDSLGNYGSDLAVLQLKDSFNFSDQVFPICLNGNMRGLLRSKNFIVEGKVAGMGITEKGVISRELRAIDVRIISEEECVQNQRQEFKKYITISSFCGKGLEGVICNGDSGSGLATKDKTTGRWTLQGVVSISPKDPRNILCDRNHSTIFTNVGIYTDWIYSYYSST